MKDNSSPTSLTPHPPFKTSAIFNRTNFQVNKFLVMSAEMGRPLTSRLPISVGTHTLTLSLVLSRNMTSRRGNITPKMKANASPQETGGPGPPQGRLRDQRSFRAFLGGSWVRVLENSRCSSASRKLC